ncbi:hypothetical protein BpHYR1_049222 [Brachionus plicatilis]|uniref:Uncharacterized protein n=1 Tax=Brachionus plicatilis TaxID=10195 RepID=A0A3M7RX24_BRAPC|nr:hypothetical protein BpHYR1_049222 [Brachionus plicatilis]
MGFYNSSHVILITETWFNVQSIIELENFNLSRTCFSDDLLWKAITLEALKLIVLGSIQADTKPFEFQIFHLLNCQDPFSNGSNNFFN